MNKKIASVALIFLTALSAGCSITADRYHPTADNQQHIKSFNVKMNVAEFTAEKTEYNFLCRLANTVGLPDKNSFEEYIQNALIEELKMAGMFSIDSEITIYGHLNETSVSSGMTDAHWTFDITISNSQGDSFDIRHKREYSASFLGDIACSNDMPKSLMPSVQELVREIINHHKFNIMFLDQHVN